MKLLMPFKPTPGRRAWLLLLLPLAALAQTTAPPPAKETGAAPTAAAKAASAPLARSRLPEPGTVEPDPKATTQLRIPLRATPDSPPPKLGARRAAPNGTGGGIDDAAARCNALDNADERAQCLAAARAPRK